MSWAAIASAAVSVGGSLLSKPKAPATAQYTPVNIQDQQTNAIAGNLGNENSIENLVSQGNSFNQSQALSLAEKAMPGYTKLAASLTNRATQLADHPYDVPQEVQDNLTRIAAEKGISAGTRGQFNDFSLLRDLGVNELQYGQTAINQSQALAGTLSAIAPKVNPMSPLSFYVSPAQAIATTTSNNVEQQAIAQGAANASAAASNSASADLWGSLTKIAGLYAASNTGTKTTNTNAAGGGGGTRGTNDLPATGHP